MIDSVVGAMVRPNPRPRMASGPRTPPTKVALAEAVASQARPPAIMRSPVLTTALVPSRRTRGVEAGPAIRSRRARGMKATPVPRAE